MATSWMRRTLGALAILLLAVAAAADAPQSPLKGEGFAHYTLALTWHPGFCESRSRPPRECREPALRRGAERGFVLHGLWPSLPERFAAQGVDRRRWWQEGCFLERPRADGSFCRAHPPLELPEALDESLDAAMPGRASCLERYQFAKHAACLDLPEADYFAASVALVEAVNASAFGAFVALNQGGEVGRNDLIHAFEAAFGEGSGRALRLECRGRGNRLLTEVRIAIATDRLADFPAAGSLARQDRGRCAARVRIATF
ncbi:ribonuclease T2 family protein [Halomonas heilongjiangensis]|uniref:Ribonuclease I n=1 Tax=Halomonas heilongjiangensis TaxID=1387883 RepID=A0A2N7TLR2_9GAMM|nr:ribonuclease I [Halomonas heilongjiangensis]PMR69125.1 ribonuclease I [Halomonas heilongjiangensis]PXX94151.1 ribonuclease I [Halomonas heilongjiangensis]